MIWLDLFTAVLATWQIVEIWHHGSLFAEKRAMLELYNVWYSRLLGCPFCLTPWVAVIIVFLSWLWPWPVYALAVARLANLSNDILHTWCRTPGQKKVNTERNDLENEKDQETYF